MKRAILISIRPEWVAKILNGEKTIEIRKTAPKCDLPIDVYIYCTTDRKYGYMHNGQSIRPRSVVAKFTLGKVTQYIAGNNMDEDHPIGGDAFIKDEVLNKACITEEELLDYTKHNDKNPYDFTFFAWHIDDLVVFSKPKELSEFKCKKYHYSSCKHCPHAVGMLCNADLRCDEPLPITKAPLSWQYAEVDE